MTPTVDDLIRPLPGDLREAFKAVNDPLIGAGCSSDVKTIYVSYTYDGEMVAALYPHAGSIEIALALPDDHPSGDLRDASHLTWRTLPVSVLIESSDSAVLVLPLIQEALDRVRTGVHDVRLDDERFIAARRARRGVGGDGAS